MTDQLPEEVDYFYVPDKDPDYRYRWLNDRDRNLIMAQFEGWEPVYDEQTIAQVPLPGGQQGANQTPGSVRRRGDLVLYRMSNERFDRTIGRKIREARERHASTIDTLVAQANDNAKKALQDRGTKVPDRPLVFIEHNQ